MQRYSSSEGSRFLAHGDPQKSSEFLRILRSETPLLEFLRIPVRSDTPPTLIGNEVSGALPEFLKIPYSETPLKDPVRSDTPLTFIGNEVSGASGAQKLHCRSF